MPCDIFGSGVNLRPLILLLLLDLVDLFREGLDRFRGATSVEGDEESIDSDGG
jgi:hypothetical protein